MLIRSSNWTFAITQRAENAKSKLAELEAKYESLTSVGDHEVQSSHEEERTQMKAPMKSLVNNVEINLKAQTHQLKIGFFYAQAKGNISLVFELDGGKVMDFQK